ncbi:MAG: hypothetical protein HY318_12900, partial [Armatimonadetes bacterium]|nr:hypothetical protein [Armatimonadota bacterium]
MSSRTDTTMIFQDLYRDYLDSLRSPGDRPHWDVVVLTAAHAQQAESFQLQLDQRREADLLPQHTQFTVIADRDSQSSRDGIRPGRAIRRGSGGATLQVLAHLARKYREKTPSQVQLTRDAAHAPRPSPSGGSFQGRRILVIHSGGDSQRLPHASILGKVFATLPRELPGGRLSSIFDEFLIALSGLPHRMREGVVIVSGDVLPVLDAALISLPTDGIADLTLPAPVGTGTRHGVVLADAATGQVRRFLHKASVEELQKAGVVDSEGCVPIDSGIVWLGPTFASQLSEIAFADGRSRENPLPRQTSLWDVTLNFYGDFLGCLGTETDRDSYLMSDSDGPRTEALLEVRSRLWDQLHDTSFHACHARGGRFIHFGSTAEYRDTLLREAGMNGMEPGDRQLGWTRHAHSFGAPNQSCCSFNTFQSSDFRSAAGCLLGDSSINCGGQAEEGAVVLGVDLGNSEPDFKLHVPADTVLQVTPVVKPHGAFVARLFGVHDNPKLTCRDPQATLLNRPWQDWFDLMPSLAETCWEADDDKRALWNARLFPVKPSIPEAIEATLLLCQALEYTVKGRASREQGGPEQWSQQLRSWREAQRLSLRESYEKADPVALLQQREAVGASVRGRRFLEAVKSAASAEECEGSLGTEAAQVHAAAEAAATMLHSHPEHSLRVHGFQCLSRALRKDAPKLAGQHEARAFAELAEWVQTKDEGGGMKDAGRKQQVRLFHPSSFITHPLFRVRVAAPVRIDFGGGWSDTPPFSLEQGGVVLNAAVTHNGVRPVVAEVFRSQEPTLLLESRDLGVTQRITSTDDLLDYQDPADPLSLHKAALVFALGMERGAKGLASGTERRCQLRELDRQLCELELPALRLVTDIDVPKGSGLGVSSIACGALLRALHVFFGETVTDEKLFDEVLSVEQMLTTGGGWQDQVGGLAPGIKLISSQPGVPQHLQVESVHLPEELREELASRMLLIYTGQRRLARDLLRKIMGRYMANDPEATQILKDLRIIARDMAASLREGDLDSFGQLLTRHWNLNKALDPGSATSQINGIFDRLQPWMSGGKMCGAGGGGFMVVLARDAEGAERIRKLLASEKLLSQERGQTSASLSGSVSDWTWELE